MVLVCLPSDALSQHLPSYLGFSYLGCGVSLYGCSSKVQPLLLTLDVGYLLTAAPLDLERGVAPLGASAPGTASCCSLDVGLLLLVAAPYLEHGVAPLGALGMHKSDSYVCVCVCACVYMNIHEYQVYINIYI